MLHNFYTVVIIPTQKTVNIYPFKLHIDYNTKFENNLKNFFFNLTMYIRKKSSNYKICMVYYRIIILILKLQNLVCYIICTILNTIISGSSKIRCSLI